ncbi:hypothetical protein B0A54_18089 [Friedmanniomyces endolithicus]|uniref:DUF6606 domain-containing protein n=1 Tax=Friedmanniomyces endolithicus TaxID=329885 RepID=A0A4U0TK37_9PEZI|nr:hypothetical protein B0A54_18089 [Friedmanniomyces endolithicus]
MASQGQLLPRQEMTLYQDVPGDLDLFVRLAKAGHFECTEQFFTEALGGLGNVFAVFTEYVDMLIDQGAFDRAADTVQKILGASVADGNSAFSDEQRTVLNLDLISRCNNSIALCQKQTTGGTFIPVESTCTMAAYRSLVDHVFLPPVLPQSDAGDAFDILIQTTFKALIEYKRLRADQHSSVENAIRMTGNMATAHVDSYIDEEKLARLMEAIPRDGGSIVLPVSAQNAGMIISRVSALDTGFAIRFEAFELAPINQAVYQSKGRLGRSFPGSAIDIDIPTFAEPGLVDTIARTLAKMNFQAAPGMQPQVRKAALAGND